MAIYNKLDFLINMKIVLLLIFYIAILYNYFVMTSNRTVVFNKKIFSIQYQINVFCGEDILKWYMTFIKCKNDIDYI